MIFATVGSSTIPFDRLVRALGSMETDEDLVVQTGVSTVRPRRAKVLDYLGYDDFVALIRSARIVVTHAGAGSVITALGEGKRPIVVPRRAAQREAVDDHQVAFARRAAELGLVTLVEDVSLLAATLRDHEPSLTRSAPEPSPIERELRSYIEHCVGPATVDSAELSQD
jgi:UDP-N-acetylglucosamine transferase subunit ALG13